MTMKGVLIDVAVVMVTLLIVLQQTIAGHGCDVNVQGCPNPFHKTRCNTCCQGYGCDKGSCVVRTCICQGCDIISQKGW